MPNDPSSNDEIIVVSIDLHAFTNISEDIEALQAFTILNPEEKISFLAKQIENAYNHFHQANPEAKIIIAWPEYALNKQSNATLDSTKIIPLSQEAQTLFFETMQTLTTTHPGLTIIAGSTMTEKPLDQATLSSISAAYQDNAWIDAIEGEEKGQGIRIFTDEKETVENLNRQLESEGPSALKDHTVVENTCYIFNGNEQPHKVGKLAPADELKWLENPDKAIYAPPSEGSDFCVVPITADTNIAIDICRTHAVGIAKRQVASERDTDDPAIAIHFIVSAGISFQPEMAVDNCPVAIHLDAISEDPAAYRLDDTSTATTVKFFNHTLTQREDTFSDMPLIAATDRCKLLDMMDVAIKKCDNPKRKELLIEARKTIHDLPNDKHLSPGAVTKVETIVTLLQNISPTADSRFFQKRAGISAIQHFCDNATQFLATPPARRLR